MSRPTRRATQILGIDFTSAPRRVKPITVARAIPGAGTLTLVAVQRIAGFAAFEELLRERGPWVGGFDFPFGMPLELVRDLGWPTDWIRLVAHCAGYTREQFRAMLDEYRHGRPAGAKYAHRMTDTPAGSSSPMKLVNPPVALMFLEGTPRLAAAGVHIPGLADGDRSRVALEAYPGMLAREITRSSYKADARAKQDSLRRAERLRIVRALEQGAHSLALPISFAQPGLRADLIEDPGGDSLDAAICALQAAWAASRARFAIPRGVPCCEGWIVGAARGRTRPANGQAVRRPRAARAPWQQ